MGHLLRHPHMERLEVTRNSHCHNSHWGSVCWAAEDTKPHHAWDGVTYQNWQWDVPSEWVSYFSPLGEGKLLNLHWYPVDLIQAGAVEIHSAWNETGTIKRRGKWEFGSSISHPPSISWCLTVLPPLTNMYGLHTIDTNIWWPSMSPPWICRSL